MFEDPHMRETDWQSKSTTLVLLKSAHLVAEYIRDDEPHGDKPDSTKSRMTNALSACQDNLDMVVFGETGAFERPSLESLCENLSTDEKFVLLVELRLADPFFPYQFEMSKKRDKLRLQAMREIAHRELHLDRDAALRVDEAMREVAKAYSKGFKGLLANLDSKDWLIIVGSGVLIAGAAVVAAPLIAAAMPAAAGLSGAAAVSAGLASLGGGSLAAGGLGMAGGMWALGVGGAAVGGAAGATAVALAGGEGAGLVKAEVLKLCMSFELARQGLISRSTSEFEEALDQIHDTVREVLKEETSRNERGSERLRNLEALDETLTFAGEFMTDRLKKHSS